MDISIFNTLFLQKKSLPHFLSDIFVFPPVSKQCCKYFVFHVFLKRNEVFLKLIQSFERWQSEKKKLSKTTKFFLKWKKNKSFWSYSAQVCAKYYNGKSLSTSKWSLSKMKMKSFYIQKMSFNIKRSLSEVFLKIKVEVFHK